MAAYFRPDKIKDFKIIQAVCYIIAQFTGFAAGVLGQFWFDQKANELRFKRKEGTDDEYFWSEGTWMEIFACFIFVFVWLNQTGPSTKLTKDFATQTFVIGVTYGTLIHYTYQWTGGSINPAFAVAQDVWNFIDSGEDSALQFLPLYGA